MDDKAPVLEKYEAFEERFRQIEAQMAEPEIIRDAPRYQKLARERSGMLEKIETYREFLKTDAEARRLELMLKEASQEREFLDLVREELPLLRAKAAGLFAELENALIDADPQLDKDIIVEIRAGTGGEEAALFAADLYRMYQRYAERRGFSVEVISSSPSQMGGFKEIIFSVEGRGAYRNFKHESGVHRVQRVPATEASGRIHTSAVSVAVLPEAEDVEVRLNPAELRIDVYRSAGPGGQGVNTTDSAVRITHVPTGIVVTCQDERSQLKNKAKGMKVLRARLLDNMRREQEMKISRERRQQIGSGDRSEKIRTYNFPDRRITDHRIGFTLYKIEQVLEGDLDELVGALAAAERRLKLKQHQPQPETK